MPLHLGSCFPLDSGGYVVTVYCPNDFAKARLMYAIDHIEPEAGDPLPVPASISAPTGHPPRAWTAQEVQDFQKAMQRINEREQAANPPATDTGD